MKYLIFLVFAIIAAAALPLQFPIVALLLLTKWDGRSTIFGNEKWGRGENHYSHPTVGYWQQFVWLTLRNPTNNLCAITLACYRTQNISSTGDLNIGDKIAGGHYYIKMGRAWEYYLIVPYGRHCIRVRLGWKIAGKNVGELCGYVLVINPFMPYSGK